ncbi:protein DBF4 homolog B [Perognathus longimembris pacificus]|uniref:protein DBF4 homolog B n=1 Tax=Perognathus longimembris pacificus TaxID=214514 RepID=UPI0020197292|nr:protein DBF4 homolog B [Perognathus longimembris pacificus]
MAERRLRAPDRGAHPGVSCCLRKCQKSTPGSGRQPFSGKSFYLDLPAGKNLQFLTRAVQQLGGVIEGFLSKEVSYIVSSRREAKAESSGTSHRCCPSPSKARVETASMANPKGCRARPSQSPVDTLPFSSWQVPLSRGKELLQKAIKNQGSSSSLLTNARSWGVKVLHVEEMVMHVRQLSLRGSSRVKKQEPKKPDGTHPGVESRARKAARLKSPFLKIEDVSRKFRPFHRQFKSFPEISFLGPKAASPFEVLTTPSSLQHSRELRDPEPSLQSAAYTLPRRKKGYCECCKETFGELHVHLQSARHQSFALEAHPYAEIDGIIAQLSHSFADISSQATVPRQSGSPASRCDILCPETPPPSQPCQPRTASPEMRKEDDGQTPWTAEQHRTVGSTEEPAEPTGTGDVPGSVASCQELAGAGGVLVTPPGTQPPTPVTHCLLTKSDFTNLSSGPNRTLARHKRKVQFPSGCAKKRPGTSWPHASFYISRALYSCGATTTEDRDLLSFSLSDLLFPL